MLLNLVSDPFLIRSPAPLRRRFGCSASLQGEGCLQTKYRSQEEVFLDPKKGISYFSGLMRSKEPLDN